MEVTEKQTTEVKELNNLYIKIALCLFVLISTFWLRALAFTQDWSGEVRLALDYTLIIIDLTLILCFTLILLQVFELKYD